MRLAELLVLYTQRLDLREIDLIVCLGATLQSSDCCTMHEKTICIAIAQEVPAQQLFCLPVIRNPEIGLTQPEGNLLSE